MSERRQTLALMVICLMGVISLISYILLGYRSPVPVEMVQALKEITTMVLGGLLMYVRVRAIPDEKEENQ